ncbi:3-dehydroshikimate dehydratase [Trichoderma cornu-damae]|uniref:3-dehydroshikimate dehydratase n=1 Tax=Trichoderma cornu-damae TaxID=654480 RepID=A0A9P8TUH5_9HYPO|nr:3-dehydroshikimate dehydratase [Trichoderma cornu-damae]
MSLGRCYAGHSLPHKLSMARKYGFSGIELFYEDLLEIAKNMPGGATPENHISSAQLIRRYCDERNLQIICLQPFMHYEGLVDRSLHHRRIEELRLWFKMAHVLGTDLIMLPSSNLPPHEITEEMDCIVQDMVEIADMALQESPVIRFAYEALCWGTRVDTWEASWEVVCKVNRPNFGLCLDTFNIAGRIYADPAMSTGLNPDANQALAESLDRLVFSVPADKVFLLQVADGERLEKPLLQGHAFYNSEQPPRMSWSRNARLFYGEAHYGGYLPIRDILSALVSRIGFQGWISLEVFNRRLADSDQSIPEEMGRRAAQSWSSLESDLCQITHNLGYIDTILDLLRGIMHPKKWLWRYASGSDPQHIVHAQV